MVGSSSGGWIKVIFMMNFASANLNRGEGRPAGQVKLLTYPTVILIAASGSATGLVLGWNSPIWRGPSIPPGESHGILLETTRVSIRPRSRFLALPTG